MRILINDIQFLNADLIDLVEDINTRHIDSVSLNRVDQLVNSGIASEMNISVGKLVLFANGNHSIFFHVCHL